MFLLINHFWHFQPYTGKRRGVARWDPAHVTPIVKLYKHTKFKICSSKGFFWGLFLVTMVTTFRNFFGPCFKLDQNLSSCQISEKFTHRFCQNDGTNIQTDRHMQTSPYIYIYIYIYIGDCDQKRLQSISVQKV